LHIENAKFLGGNYTPTSKSHFILPTLSFLLVIYTSVNASINDKVP